MRTGAPFTMWFWIIGLSALFVGPPVLIVGASVLISTRRARRGKATTRPDQARPDQTVHRARIGRLTGLGVGALVGAVAFLAGFGLIAPILVAVGYLAGVLVVELRPATRPTGPIREASLQARSAWPYLPRWVVPAIVAAAGLALVAPALFATVSPPPPNYFRWMIALSVPLTAIAVLAVGGFVLLMTRLAALPQPGPPQPGSPDRDGPDRDRANTARAIAGAVLGIELLALGGLAIVASTDAIGPFVTTGLAFVAARILIWSGLGLALTGMLTWAVLGRWRNAPAAPAEPPEPTSPSPASPSPASPSPATPSVA